MFIISTTRLTHGKFEIADDIADKLARLILMIETGKRLFVNGVKVDNPEPLTVKDMGYCNVAMYSTEGRIVILCPYEIPINRAITLLVQKITDFIRKYDETRPALLLGTTVFERNIISYDEQPANMRGINGCTFKRIFRVDDSWNDRSAFDWVICDCLPAFCDDPVSTFEWCMMRTTIIVDLTGQLQPESKLIEYPKVSSQIDILTQCSIIPKDLYEYSHYNHTYVTHECFGILPLNMHVSHISLPNNIVSSEMKDDVTLCVYTSKNLTLARKTTPIECKSETCQMCYRKLYDQYYAVLHSDKKAYGFCKYCAHTKKFSKLTTDECVYRLNHSRVLDDVAQDVFGMSGDDIRTCNNILTEWVDDAYAHRILCERNVMVILPSPVHMNGNDMMDIDMYLTSVEPENRRIIHII